MLNIFRMMMLNKMFMLHYQLNLNTSCKVKYVVDRNRQPKRLSNRRRSQRPFSLPPVYPGVTPLMMPG